MKKHNQKKDYSKENKDYEKYRIKIFITEILREPIDETIKLIKGIGRPKAWKIIGFILMIISAITQNKLGTILSIALIITMEAYQQWIDGSFMKRHRQRKYGQKYYNNNKK